MELSQLLGYLATFLFSVVMIPQVIKTLQRNSVKDISLSMLVISLLANCVALWYAILIHQMPLIVKYVIAGTVLIAYICLYFKIRNRESSMSEQIIEEQCPSGKTNLTEVKRPRKAAKKDKEESK